MYPRPKGWQGANVQRNVGVNVHPGVHCYANGAWEPKTVDIGRGVGKGSDLLDGIRDLWISSGSETNTATGFN